MIKVLLNQMMGSTKTSVTQGGGKLVTLRGLEDVSKLPDPSTVSVSSHVK
jgi:hypothetical protein